jgi:hypothetical protein
LVNGLGWFWVYEKYVVSSMYLFEGMFMFAALRAFRLFIGFVVLLVVVFVKKHRVFQKITYW